MTQETPAGPVRHRKYVGPGSRYDLAAANQFSLLTALGLREEHYLLDVGCGSLRAGRLFIPYLLPGRYHGIEPNRWLIEEGIAHEVGRDQVALKAPVFSNNGDFTLTTFGRRFDFILAQSIFSHAAPRHITRCLAQAREALNAEGILAATFLQGPENYQGEEWIYPGSVTYTLEQMTTFARDAGLICRALGWSHHNRQTWVAFLPPEGRDRRLEVVDAPRLAVLEADLRQARADLEALRSQAAVRLYLRVQRRLKKLGLGRNRKRPG